MPIDKEELKIMCRVIDPDQSGAVSLHEWLDFALATEEDLLAQTLAANEKARAANAAKGSDRGGIAGFVQEGMQYSREIVSAVPMGTTMLATIEHPLDTSKKAMQGVTDLAEMEARWRFVFIMRNYLSKVMNSASQMMSFALKMMSLALKMMNLIQGCVGCCRRRGQAAPPYRA